MRPTIEPLEAEARIAIMLLLLARFCVGECMLPPHGNVVMVRALNPVILQRAVVAVPAPY
jgi:hypothetical protein